MGLLNWYHGIVSWRYRSYAPEYISHDLAANTLISKDGIDISIVAALTPARWNPKIQIFVDGYENLFHEHLITAGYTDFRFMLEPVLPDGRTLDLEVALVDIDGESFPLEFTWHAYCLGFSAVIPHERRYSKLTIGSNLPFTAHLIRWFEHDDRNRFANE